MDPLTIGFEEALHRANRAAEADALERERLVVALRRVIDASAHRPREAVTVSLTATGRIELRRGERTYVLERRAARWGAPNHPSPSFSGPVACAITAWLTS